MATRAPARRPDTNASTAVEKLERSIVTDLAERHGMPAAEFLPILRDTVFRPPKQKGGAPGKPFTNHEMAAGLAICHRYNLDPFIREIFVTRGKGGALLPIVSVDGWLAILNRQESYDGMTTESADEADGTPVSCTVTIYDKARRHPVVVTEYFVECKRGTDAWISHPRRMLRHKTIIQAIRVSYGISGIFDPDEGERLRELDDDEYTVKAAEPRAVRAPAEERSLTAPRRTAAKRKAAQTKILEPEPEDELENEPEPEQDEQQAEEQYDGSQDDGAQEARRIEDEQSENARGTSDLWDEWLKLSPILTDLERAEIRKGLGVRYLNTTLKAELVQRAIDLGNEILKRG